MEYTKTNSIDQNRKIRKTQLIVSYTTIAIIFTFNLLGETNR